MKRLILGLAILMSFGTPVALSGSAMAFNPFGNPALCNSTTANSPACKTDKLDPVSGSDKEGILIKAANLLTLLVGVASVIMIIIGGILYALSSGDSARINTAKNTVLFAIIGMVVAVLAQALIRFVLIELVKVK